MKESLEKEFYEIKNLHKCLVITSALIVCEEEGIYDTALFKDDYSDMAETGYERAEKVFEDIMNRCINGEEKYFEMVYEYCWLLIRNRISDTKSYYLSV